MLNKINSCTRCHQGIPIAFKGQEGICERCFEIEKAKMESQHGRILDFRSSPTVNEAEKIVTDFKQNVVKKIMADIKNVDVIFTDPQGAKRQIRITQEEQNAIAEKIVMNRQTGKKAYMYGDVVVVSLENITKVDAIIKRVADFDVDTSTVSDFTEIVKDAQKFLDDIQPKEQEAK